MDEFLALVGVQAMRYAIRSSIALASTYAIGQLSYLVKSADDHEVYARLKTLYDHFESKVKVSSHCTVYLLLGKCVTRSAGYFASH